MGARVVSPEIRRRTFVARGLLLAALGSVRRLRAAPGSGGQQPSGSVRYRPLVNTVVVPLADLTVPWRARPFIADALTLSSAAKPNEPIRISGFVLRTAEGDDQPDRFRAVCAKCPHEHCDVDFVTDTTRLPVELVQEIGRALQHPVYVCPCHNGTFNANDGERLAGPAPRGLYRFRVSAVTATRVEIGEVEEDLLLFT